MYNKYNSEEAVNFAPRCQAKIILADDDVLCNFAVKTMITKLANYNVVACFDGTEVGATSEKERRPVHTTKRTCMKSAW